MKDSVAARYWRTNLKIMAVLLLIWAVAGFGLGIIGAPALNEIRLGGFPLGFWFAQQGSIIVFVLLIGIYAALMNRVDDRHHRELQEERSGEAGK
jgi:putative solute:sodium symporter small subunit